MSKSSDLCEVILMANAEKQTRTSKKKNLAPKKLQLLITVVNRKKAEFYTDFLQEFEVNMQLSFAADGTANTEMLNLLGLSDSEKSVIFSIIKEEKLTALLVQNQKTVVLFLKKLQELADLKAERLKQNEN